MSGQGSDGYKTLDLIRKACDLFNEADANAKAVGMSFGIHNHWWEYLQVENKFVYEYMLDLLDPDITFEIDTYWVKAAGVDPSLIVAKMGARSPLLHIKDGPAVRDQPMTPIGTGVMDFPAIVKAGEGHTEWMIIELDRCATDMVKAVRKSYDYLVGEGLARGNK